MNVEAYILVGGTSSRFGSDKALAKIDGATLAERARDVVREALGDLPLFLVGDPERFGREAARLAIPIIHDQIVDRGPIGGLHASLANAKSEWIFLLACDLPLMTSGFISSLREACGEGDDAVLPEQPDGRMQPLCAFYRVSRLRPIVNEIVARKPDAAMMSIIDGLRERVVRSEHAVLWTNLNTEDKLAEIARKLSHCGSI